MKPSRNPLPAERPSIVHKFSIGGHEGYLIVGVYEDGSPGELFIVMSKEGSTIRGLMDSLAVHLSIALQYGVPLEAFINKMKDQRFEPSGFTGNEEIPLAKSVVDYIYRWLELKFLITEEKAED